MRPLRFLLALTTCIAAFFLVLFTGPWRASTTEDVEVRHSIRAYFSWRAPSSLFPPSAIIGLTDDNSTFFLARPAAFGPPLPSKSLTGQLWVGSGFGDDHLGHGGALGATGELGCSDIPEWDGAKYWSSAAGSRKVSSDSKSTSAETGGARVGKSKRRMATEAEAMDVEAETLSYDDDGTDDHLHHPLSPSDSLKAGKQPVGAAKKPTHADIQSLQEGAEIAGKIVLLSRGGCGFLEKVKWVQRRGGVALIVGDNNRGRPLVTMYARGDTSNITIPSLFTSHTTAHLLSTLIPSGGALEDLSAEDLTRLGLALGDQVDQSRVKKDDSKAADKPIFTTTSTAAKASYTPKALQKGQNSGPDTNVRKEKKLGWLKSLLGDSVENKHGESSRPPSSGSLGWVLQEDFDDSKDWGNAKNQRHATTSTAPTAPVKTAGGGAGDSFVIGVQDWRDPDLVVDQQEQQSSSTSTSASSRPQRSKEAKQGALKGGSITPGSGEYHEAGGEAATPSSSDGASFRGSASHRHVEKERKESCGWFARLFRLSEAPSVPDLSQSQPESARLNSLPPAAQIPGPRQHTPDGPKRHNGLWVTLTPTSMSSSPFFDTLLVLVVSPLVTLTVVYALLLLRSRIRRRRWRAPKSVVERLPIRTYQTIPSAAPSSTTSSISTPINASTPLLPAVARPIIARSRPRSRTASDVLVQQSLPLSPDDRASPSTGQTEEQGVARLAEWRRRYGGKQRECVVCLEEYVDGVSRVMSLPCGHEFHAECITPWLTTRRRTCPICKGDVVRSLARSGSSLSPPASHLLPAPLERYHDHSDDDVDDDEIQEEAALSRNDDPAAARSVSRATDPCEDLERGVRIALDRTR